MNNILRGCTIAFVGLLMLVVTMQAATISITIENLAPTDGVYFSPVWVGFHDGSFDYFDAGVATSPGGGLERIAEDGNISVLSGQFVGSVSGGIDGVIPSPMGFPGLPVFDPGEMAGAEFDLDPLANRYMSFASMVVPSNDAFIGNDNPMAIELFDAEGIFRGKQIITILGSQIWDAGTEMNTEMDAAFINQTAPNTGVTTMDPVMLHPGYIGSAGNPGGSPIILGGMGAAGIYFDPVAADFTLSNAVVARLTIVPEPATILMLLGGSGLMFFRRRWK